MSGVTPRGGPTEDREELRSLMQRYARAADARDVDVLVTLFHPEAEVTGARGTQGVADWLDTMRGPRVFPVSMHVVGDPLIELMPGADQATLDTYAVVYQMSDPGSDSGDLTLGIRYLDEMIRWRGNWVIRRRTATSLWMR